MQPGEGLGEPGRQARDVDDAASGQQAGHPLGETLARALRSGAPDRRDWTPGSSSGSAVRAPRQDAMRRSPTPLPRMRAHRSRQDAARRARGARGVGSRPWRRSSHACQSTSSGLATKIDEYVPMMMPISRARTKSLIADPPKRNNESRVRNDGQAGHDRPGERLQDRVVDDLVERLAEVTRLVLADPIEHHDRVVDREADDRQHRGHEQRIDLDMEERAEDRERADHDDDVMEQRHERGHPELHSRGTGT